MSSIYPNAIDGYAQIPLIIDTVTQINADAINRLRSAIINIETELGTIPSGTYTTISDRFNQIDAEIVLLNADIESLQQTVDYEVNRLSSDITQLSNSVSQQFENLTNYDIPSSYKEPVRVATTENILLGATCPLQVDDVTLNVGDRILVCNQNDATKNGIYFVVSPGIGSDGIWQRDEDFNGADDFIKAGLMTYVQEGSVNGQSVFMLTTLGQITLDSTELNFIGSKLNMRSDANGTAVLGDVGSPVVLSSANTYFYQSGVTDTRDYDTAVWYVTVAAKGTATSVTVKISWLEDGTNLGPQGTEDILSGASTLSVYEATYNIASETAPFNIPVIPLNVIGPNAKIAIKADVGITTQVYARVWRKA